MSTLRTYLALSGPLSRRQYLTAGLLLFPLKIAIDAAGVYLASGEWLRPTHYLLPSLRVTDTWEISWAMVAWSIPFAWVGVTLTLRRALDAGQSAWLGVLFFVPVVNWITIFVLASLPTAQRTRQAVDDSSPGPTAAKSALIGVLASMILGGTMLALSVYALGDYGASLFVGTPFVQGAVTAFVHNRPVRRSVPVTLSVALLGITMTGLSFLLFAIEGAVCLAMAMPLALPLAAVGALVGRAMAALAPRQVVAGLLALPLFAVAEPSEPRQPRFAATTVMDVQAPPEVVFAHVVSFAELPPPAEWLFAAGIAYPTRARIQGHGVGAVRRCEFSTGAFVEPITAWEAPYLLAFDVAEQPPTMEEWSPYRRLHPPHLDGGFRSVRGEFRLTPNPNGGTHLAGTTWYELDFAPRAYWSLFADAIVHAIHTRVLTHIAARSEGR